MREIGDLFNSEGLSLYETFDDVMGFLIPLYQRRYSWDVKHVERLILDIMSGMLSIKHDKDALSFIGAVIFVEVDVESFRQKASGVVDGQQRLTTLILICALLHQELSNKLSYIKDIDGEFIDFLRNKINDKLNELFACFAKSKQGIPKKSSDYYPIIIREHVDRWHKTAGSCEYVSPVADYLNKYIEFVFKNENKEFSWSKHREEVDINFFMHNLEYISEWIKKFSEDDEDLDDILNKVLNSKIGSSLLDYREEEKQGLINGYKNFKESGEINSAIRLLCFSEYLLSRVAITNVRVSVERYGFDIFEALNTTGAPLTAIETFRPIVARYEEIAFQDKGGYERSDSKIIFDQLDKYLDSKNNNNEKTRESQEIVSRFANLTRGVKILDKLDIQRVWLKKRYEEIDDTNLDSKSNYVKYLGKVAEFRENYWDKKNIAKQLNGWHEEKEEILFHLDFLRDTKTRMVIPILLRFYLEFELDHDIDKFKTVCEKTAAFVAIWRSFTCNTGGIDTALISVMSGLNFQSKSYPGFKLGKDLKVKSSNTHELEELYLALLKKKKIINKDKWIEIASTQPMYKGSQELCKYLLMLAHHNSDFVLNKLVKGKARPHDSLNYKKFSVYRSQIHMSVEHIAPQNFAPEWDEVFDIDATIVDSIGNLTLLPIKENSASGNKSWAKKVLLFKAFSAKDEEQLTKAIDDASKAGHEFKKTTKELLRNGERLSMSENLVHFNKWDHDVVKARAINILECAWYELNKSIHFGS